MPLTRKQKKLRSEIEEIAELSAMDHWNILDYDEEQRTVRLQMMKEQLVRGAIIMRYTFIDELLSNVICEAYFKRSDKAFNYKRLWRTKRFSAFAHHMIDGLYLLNKMRLVNDLREIPKDCRRTIEALNALRNAIAHSFFPENRYQYRRHKKVVYEGQDIFDVSGFTRFQDDCQRVVNYLVKRIYGIDVAE